MEAWGGRPEREQHGAGHRVRPSARGREAPDGGSCARAGGGEQAGEVCLRKTLSGPRLKQTKKRAGKSKKYGILDEWPLLIFSTILSE